jgi:transposase
MVIRVRAALIAVRTSLANTARGLAKAMGERLPKCDADQMGVLRAESVPPKLRQLLEPLLKEVESLTEKIKDRITKEGDPYLRTMLVQGAHYILSRRGPIPI